METGGPEDSGPSRPLQRPCLVLLLVATLCSLLHADRAAAQSSAGLVAADTSSPRATLQSFIQTCNEVHERIETERFLDRASPERELLMRRMLDCLDTSGLVEHARKHRALEVAVCLKEILDRHELPPWSEIPDVAAIEAADDPEQFARWRIPGTRITIARIDEGPQKHEYLISAGTVDRAIDYFQDVGARPSRTAGPATSPGLHRWYMSAPGHPLIGEIVQRLPDRIRFGRSLGLANWKWPGLVIGLLTALVLMVVIYRVQFALARRSRGKRLWAYILTLVFPIAVFSEAFNLAILRAFEKEGIQFSLPWRVAHTSLWSEKEPIDLRIIEQGDGGTDRVEPDK